MCTDGWFSNSLLDYGKWWTSPKHLNIHIFGKGHKHKYYMWTLQQQLARDNGRKPLCDADMQDQNVQVVVADPPPPVMKICQGTHLHKLPGDWAIRAIEPCLVTFNNAGSPAFKGAQCLLVYFVPSGSNAMSTVESIVCIVLCMLSRFCIVSFVSVSVVYRQCIVRASFAYVLLILEA